jgi:transcriptional regulator with XRE-family HTH domain
MILAKQIRDLRYAKGWGPDDLADRAQISRTAIYQIECGKTETPRAATLRRIARALDVPPEHLLLGLAGEAGHTAGLAPGAGDIPERPNGLCPMSMQDDLELERKFRVLLASPLRGGVSRIVEEAFRLLPEREKV